MSLISLIEWTQRTWNCLVGCTKKSKGCMNCYAIRVAWRLMHNPNPKIAKKYEGVVAKDSQGKLNWTGRINFDEDTLLLPLHWRKSSTIFVNSESDLFHKNVREEWIDRIFAVMALCPQHTFQVLTKEPERMLDYLTRNEEERKDAIGQAAYDDHGVMFTGDPACMSEDFKYLEWPLSNLWLGVSAEDQETADKRIPLLLRTPAAVRWVSAEPLLGPIDLFDVNGKIAQSLPEDSLLWPHDLIDWVVVGGESGPDARPTHPDWVRALRYQCKVACVPFFFKQWGCFTELGGCDDPCGNCVIALPDATLTGFDWTPGRHLEGGIQLHRVSKKSAGRLLDDRTWDEFPDRRELPVLQ